MMNDCPICGRNHVITWPEFWPYRRQETLFCSDQCMDIYDVRLMNKKNGWVQGSKKKGKKTMGYTKIKKDGSPAKKSGPKPKNAKAPDDAVTKAALQHPERPIVAPVSPVVIETPETPKRRNHTLLRNSNYTVSAIRTDLGEFYYDKKFDRLDWRTIEGEEISMSPAAWFRLYEMIPEAMGILEVKTDRVEE